MQLILISINVLIFFLLSMLHLYWVFGGKWALEGSMPDSMREKAFGTSDKMQTPLIFATLIVAIGLLLFGLITALNYDFVNAGISEKYINIGTGIIAAIFLFRAIGDFKLFGLFKKNKEGIFAEKDSKIYTPLCLTISVISFLIIFI